MATLVVAAGRDTALARWEECLASASAYEAESDHVRPGHSVLSRLAPALRHRLLLEEEVLTPPENRNAPKFIEGIHRRLYWRTWLEQRPGVWADWRVRRALARSQLSPEQAARVQAIEQGRSGCAPIDYFARELVELGYMHRHARRWFACWWIRVEKLPWELGADFFYRYLLDADSASNTLSWRWVAGLMDHEAPPSFDRAELERLCAPEILGDRAGLDRIEDGRFMTRAAVETADLTCHLPAKPSAPSVLEGRIGVWVHPDDLLVECSPLAGVRPVSVAGFLPGDVMGEFGYGTTRRAFETMALEDGVERAGEHFSCPAQAQEVADLSGAVGSWVADENLQHVVAMAPWVGEWKDELDKVRAEARQSGAEVHLCRRPADARLHAVRCGDFGSFRRWFGAPIPAD